MFEHISQEIERTNKLIELRQENLLLKKDVAMFGIEDSKLNLKIIQLERELESCKIELDSSKTYNFNLHTANSKLGLKLIALERDNENLKSHLALEIMKTSKEQGWSDIKQPFKVTSSGPITIVLPDVPLGTQVHVEFNK